MNFGPADEIRKILDDRFTAREAAITGSRKVIRAAANGIRALHRGEWSDAEELISESRRHLDGIMEALSSQPELLHAGFVSDAAKEYAEARITQSLFRGEPAPGFDELGVDPVPYLHGLGEAVGEMRRRMLDMLRAERLAEAKSLLDQMDDIVDELASFDYPDGMTAGLRRTTDVARSLVERSRSDLTTTVVQERLREDLRNP